MHKCRYHVFRFTKRWSGVVEMHYKQFSKMPWEPNKDGTQLVGNKLLLVRIDKTLASSRGAVFILE